MKYKHWYLTSNVRFGMIRSFDNYMYIPCQPLPQREINIKVK